MAYKNDIFEVLKQIDNKNYDYLSTLNAEQYKDIQPYVLTKWLASTNSDTTNEYYTLAVNELVNKNFWQLSTHKDLQWKLMCACGLKKFIKHQWIPSQTIKKDKDEELIKDLFKHLNNEEFKEIYEDMSDEDKTQMLEYLGAKDKQTRGRRK